MLLITSRWTQIIVCEVHVNRAHPQQSERVLLLQLVLYLVDGSLQTGDLHAQQGLVLVQADQLSALLRLQLHLQQLLLLVQELVQVAELGLDALLEVSSVLLSEMEADVTERNHAAFIHAATHFKNCRGCSRAGQHVNIISLP